MRFSFLAGVLVLFFSAMAYADGVHTWQDVVSRDGLWIGRLVITSADQKAFFTDTSSTNRGELYDFSVSDDNDFAYGLGFDFVGTDFDLSYTLTLYQTDSSATGFVSKACVFNVTASAPAVPDIRVEKYNGANCDFEPHHGREKFIVQ